MKNCPSPNSPGVRGFTLVELLLAVFLLAIGMLGLLSIFPIGADWTRQITEESIAQNVARNAFGVIQAHYATGGTHAGQLASYINTTALQPLPNFTLIPVNERSYQYGAAVPFPAQNPNGATYFWTALIRLSPDQTTGGPGSRYDLYILVMKKGAPDDRYTTVSGTMSEIVGPTPAANQICRKTDGSEDFVPAVVLDTYFRSAKNGNGEYVDVTTRNVPQIGDFGLGKTSGTAFRVYSDPTKMFMKPQIMGTFTGPGADTGVEAPAGSPGIIWVPPSNPMARLPADPTPSPLVYIYETTIVF